MHLCCREGDGHTDKDWRQRSPRSHAHARAHTRPDAQREGWERGQEGRGGKRGRRGREGRAGQRGEGGPWGLGLSEARTQAPGGSFTSGRPGSWQQEKVEFGLFLGGGGLPWWKP